MPIPVCIEFEHREPAKSKAPSTAHLQQRAPPPGPLAPPERHLLLVVLLSEDSNLRLQGSGWLHCRCGTWPKRPHCAPLLSGMLCLNGWYATEAGPVAPSQPHYRHSLCSQMNEIEPNTHTHTTDPSLRVLWDDMTGWPIESQRTASLSSRLWTSIPSMVT